MRREAGARAGREKETVETERKEHESRCCCCDTCFLNVVICCYCCWCCCDTHLDCKNGRVDRERNTCLYLVDVFGNEKSVEVGCVEGR